MTQGWPLMLQIMSLSSLPLRNLWKDLLVPVPFSRNMLSCSSRRWRSSLKGPRLLIAICEDLPGLSQGMTFLLFRNLQVLCTFLFLTYISLSLTKWFCYWHRRVTVYVVLGNIMGTTALVLWIMMVLLKTVTVCFLWTKLIILWDGLPGLLIG